MKFSVFLFLLVLPFCNLGYSQMNEVTGGNIGLTGKAGIILNSPAGRGFGYGGGVTTSFKKIVFPEINFEKRSVDYGLDTLGTELSSSRSFLGLGLNTKIPILNFSLNKSSKGECRWFLIKLILDYNYKFQLGNNANFAFEKQNETGVNLGLGFRTLYSGGHKSRVAWNYYYDVFYHYDLNKSIHSSIGNEEWRQNGVYFRVTIVHYRTTDFLDSGINKKKAYKRKYK